MKRRTVVTAVTTLIAAGVTAGVLGLAVVAAGLVPISAISPHLSLTTVFLHFTFKRAVAHGASNITAPEDLFSDGRIALGAKHYANECSKCHGGPGIGQNPIALSMRPRPQHLAEVVGQFTDPELFWILQNGVKFSAMPSWPSDRKDEEIWSTVAFIRQLPTMTPAAYLALVEPPSETVPAVPYGPAVTASATRVPRFSGPVDEYFYASPATEWHDMAMTGLPLATCVSCHGVDGTGSPTSGQAPNLAIQTADYLRGSLDAYAHRTRHSGYMEPLASTLSPSQIDQLATWFADLPDQPARSVAPDPALIEAGARIAMTGVPERGVPSCLSCHEKAPAAGVRPGITIPHLYGQSQAYIGNQLDAFAGSDRGASGPYNPMPAVASNLTAEERRAVAAWFAVQAPGSVGPAPAPAAPVDLTAARATVEQVCSKCHGSDGIGNATGEYPNLTLEGPDYIALSLHSFRLKTRHASRMNETASRLTDGDIAGLAAYFGEMGPVRSPSPRPDDAATLARGEAIAQGGLPDRGVPACLTCHSAASIAEVPIIARLDGQHAVYLKSRLDYFSGVEPDRVTSYNPMPGIASRLTDAERADVIAWFAAQEPLPKR